MKIDMNKLVALVKGTKGLLTDKQAVSQVTVKGVSDYVTQVDFRVQEYPVSYTHLDVYKRQGNCPAFCQYGYRPVGDGRTAGKRGGGGTALSAHRAGTDEGRICGEPGGQAAGNQGD